MALSTRQAKDEILSILQTAWNSGTTAIVGYVPFIIYHGIEKVVPPSDKYFAKADIQIMKRKQATLSTNVLQANKRRYNTKGILLLQIQCPLSDVQNSDKGSQLAELAMNAFQGKQSPCGVVFYGAMYTPSFSTEVFSKYIMTVEFNFDEIG